MTLHDPILLKETLNRSAKIDVDSGTAPDFETAVRRLHGHRVQVRVGPEVATSAAHQAALLTVVNVARRFALGGVLVEGALAGVAMTGPLPGVALEHAVRSLGGTIGAPEEAIPTIVIGTVEGVTGRGMQVTFEGWRGGVVRLGGHRLSEVTSNAMAAVLGAALATGEAFAMLRGEVEAGRRSLGLSLWRPDRIENWQSPSSDGPELRFLPDHLWVLGLGHLGQAFLWASMMCPFPDPAKVRVTLQDMDFVTGSTDSTSILTQIEMVGRRKTRSVADVLERRGFTTTLIERPFDDRFQHDPANDPAVLVCGVDNALARSRLEAPGFPFIVEAGIGHRAGDYRALRIHTFPSSGKTAAELWGARTLEESLNLNRPAYRRLAESGGDVCGLALLAETAVGAPFVGTVAGVLMLAQVMRLTVGDAPDALIDLDLRAMGARRALANDAAIAAAPSYQPRHDE